MNAPSTTPRIRGSSVCSPVRSNSSKASCTSSSLSWPSIRSATQSQTDSGVPGVTVQLSRIRSLVSCEKPSSPPVKTMIPTTAKATTASTPAMISAIFAPLESPAAGVGPAEGLGCGATGAGGCVGDGATGAGGWVGAAAGAGRTASATNEQLPILTSSPPASETGPLRRWPLTKVPLAEPRSSMPSLPSGSAQTRAWRRETSSSSSLISTSGSRPMTYSPVTSPSLPSPGPPVWRRFTEQPYPSAADIGRALSRRRHP